ncbi:FAD-dependent monooxygenase [Kitasatospora sp. NBC_01250]|uniref:FAD-dependent monooxygenase n=1 Tax=Kitasatospora sp. NBC_01250 TaxID=2903571 RepID=UPI002E36D0CB|nr:FAD-dependent monooxygenase [Kitasatospora sp. NBC_01250]
MATVMIAGAGPTGLMLACELRLAGIDVVLVDRLPGRSGQSRAGGMHARTMEVMDQRGLLDGFLTGGVPMQIGHFSGLELDFSGLATRYPHMLRILQSDVEVLLEEHLAKLGTQVRWSAGVTGIRQGEHGVTVELGGDSGDGEELVVDYLVGCDGGRSTVRKLLGIGFPGTEPTLSSILGDVELTDPPAAPIVEERRPNGRLSVFAFGENWWRVTTTEYDAGVARDTPVDVEDLRATLIRVAGTDFGMHSPRWVSRFNDSTRQADRYRQGRVLLAGDAAHIHFPAGGQGMNLGIQDAVNLGWKLALVARGQAPAHLLDSYQAERHPVAARVLANTRAQTALGRPDTHTSALREVFETLMAQDTAGPQYLAAMVSALDIRYPLGDGHPLTGRRVPDFDLTTGSGSGSGGRSRVFELLHGGRGVLLDLAGHAGTAAVLSGWAGRVDLVTARRAEPTVAVPGLGRCVLPRVLLIRPDGHVAWCGPTEPAGDGVGVDLGALHAALTDTFGPAEPPHAPAAKAT